MGNQQCCSVCSSPETKEVITRSDSLELNRPSSGGQPESEPPLSVNVPPAPTPGPRTVSPPGARTPAAASAAALPTGEPESAAELAPAADHVPDVSEDAAAPAGDEGELREPEDAKGGEDSSSAEDDDDVDEEIEYGDGAYLVLEPIRPGKFRVAWKKEGPPPENCLAYSPNSSTAKVAPFRYKEAAVVMHNVLTNDKSVWQGYVNFLKTIKPYGTKVKLLKNADVPPCLVIAHHPDGSLTAATPGRIFDLEEADAVAVLSATTHRFSISTKQNLTMFMKKLGDVKDAAVFRFP